MKNTTEIDDDEISPAARPTSHPAYFWPNGSKIYKHENTGDLKNITISNNVPLPNPFSYTIRLNKITNFDHATIGFTNSIKDNQACYVGDGDMGNWGLCVVGVSIIASSYTFVEWKLRQDDTMTINGDNGDITFQINGVENNYKYHVDNWSDCLYLAATFYDNEEFEILS